MSNLSDDLFHKCAWVAFMEATAYGKQDDQKYVKARAYSLYEEELKVKNAT